MHISLALPLWVVIAALGAKELDAKQPNRVVPVYCLITPRAVWDTSETDIDPGILRAELIDNAQGLYRLPICPGAADSLLFERARGNRTIDTAGVVLVPCAVDYVLVVVHLGYSSQRVCEGFLRRRELVRYSLLLRYILYRKDTLEPVTKSDISLSMKYHDSDCRECRLLLLRNVARETAKELRAIIKNTD